ncbi:3-hydroxybutyryl-CoA dehydrogenase [Nocardioides marmoribigeumensis]|uniref:3-hydroxybutyryl-CoA dehydrogenase n=1 Tax=Nocardioides marmoribigeumensis TaxID=433649 RepID=A0ABU2BXR0_9ACTN|nr:3-hydroxybutyryl-CoA dehydrogenase [Nocardioides marmoribigeumensis]MDR7363177.1 3-hydroxybutyryl-CoA dehydrogenase [Nocardioides marmoribigeumensis]
MSAIERVGVVGAGQMGAGIAEVCARAGVDVLVCEADDERVEAARNRIEASLARAVRKGKLTHEVRDRAAARLSYTSDLAALAGRDLVVEAVVEDPRAKMQVLAELDRAVDAHAVLASNTSSIPIIDLGMASGRPDRVIGLHFFNPVPIMSLVEVITSLKTSPETAERATDFVASTLGKQVITSQDRAGFVVNALLVPYLLSAIRMLESGLASADDIDAGMRLGCAHPMGPLELADLIGLDTTAAIAESLYDELKEPHLAPPALLLRMVKAQQLGRKTGRGFFAYAA